MMAMLESRLKIKDDEDVTLSPQYAVSCNFYTEGCEGGYPTLVARFISEFDLVPEECFPFAATDESCTRVCDVSKLKKTYTVSEYGYIGGYYGASSEENMMAEIFENGPIVANFEPPMDFSYYVGGVYKKVSNHKVENASMKQEGIQFEKVDHSVLIVGWGVDENTGEKYWKI
jgi:cathepsin C